MRIGIVGTRGIPNHYGGFEQFAEYLSVALVERGHQVWVYNSSTHPHQQTTYKGVNIIHCYDPEHKIGTAGQFIYDFNCIIDSRKRDFDVLLQLGYTSSSVWHFLLPEQSVVITNMDGLEWKRSKYSKKVQWFLKHAEKWAVTSSNVLVADSKAIQSYLLQTYKQQAHYIAYGATPFYAPNEATLQALNLLKQQYYLVIARFEPENNIETIIQGYLINDNPKPLVLIGSTHNKFGAYLQQQYKHANIRFLGSIYDMELLNNLRYFCALYFHGHSVGGTNPSLLEAMASHAPICAHDNAFNKAILGDDAVYFSSAEEVASIIKQQVPMDLAIQHNMKKVMDTFSWPLIFDAYESLMQLSLRK